MLVIIGILMVKHDNKGPALGWKPSLIGSPYSVEYKLFANRYYGGVQATVKGPAARLAIILTDSKGKSDVKIIEKEHLITNSETVSLNMEDPQAGTCVLAVKTFDPEKIVWQKKIALTPGISTVNDVKLKLDYNPAFNNYWRLSGIQIVLQQTGTLPILFTDASVTLDGIDCQCSLESLGIWVPGQGKVNLSVIPKSKTKQQLAKTAEGGHIFDQSYDPGERHLVKGTLFSGKDHTPLAFERECVVPPIPQPAK